MTVSFDDFYSRHYPLASLGKENQQKLHQSHAIVLGVGGLGTVSSSLLESIGVGHLRLVDYDVVEASNLPRQRLYRVKDIGKGKAELAAEILMERNPFIETEVKSTRVDALSIASLLEGQQVIIDGLDHFNTRRIVNRMAFAMKIPMVFAGVIGENANLMTFTYKEGTPCYECIFGQMEDDPENTCAIRGVTPIILHLAGGIQAQEATTILLGKQPTLESTLMLIDSNTLEFERITLKQNDECKVCGTSDTTDVLDSGRPGETTRGFREVSGFGEAMITSLCGRDTYIVDPKWDIVWDFVEVIKALEQNVAIVNTGQTFVTLKIGQGQISLLESGVMTIRNTGSASTALKLVKDLFETINKS